MTERREMISVKDLHFKYGDNGFSLKIPDMEIKKGEKVAIIGSSGSGKTTLIYLIAGVISPDSGLIFIDRELLTQFDEEGLRDLRILKIGFIFQEFELLEYLTVNENILLPYLVNKSLKLTGEVQKAAKNLADSTDMGDKLKRFTGELSQGEKQRVAICRALITQPDIIIADEPTGNLDPEHTRSIMRIILEQVKIRNTTLLMVTHDHSLLSAFDRVIDLNDYLHRTQP